MEKEKDVDLLVMMKWKQDHPETARQAWGEFYRRFAPYLHDRLCKNPLVDADAVLSDVFLYYFKRPDSVDTDRLSALDSDDLQRKAIKAMLGKKANWVMTNHFKRESAPIATDRQLESLKTSDSEAQPPGTEVARAKEAILALNEREQRIVLTSLAHYDADTRECIIPGELLDKLAAELGMTTTNIRVTRSRIFERLKKLLSAA